MPHLLKLVWHCKIMNQNQRANLQDFKLESKPFGSKKGREESVLCKMGRCLFPYGKWRVRHKKCRGVQ